MMAFSKIANFFYAFSYYLIFKKGKGKQIGSHLNFCISYGLQCFNV